MTVIKHLRLQTISRVQVEGNSVKIRKEPGWLFGDVALLFNSQRSASVVAATDISLWALNGRFFSQVCKFSLFSYLLVMPLLSNDRLLVSERRMVSTERIHVKHRGSVMSKLIT